MISRVSSPTAPLSRAEKGAGGLDEDQMSGSIFDRLRRQIGPRMSDEHDFGDQSHTPDQGATERDLGADAMSELARLISLPDPLTPVPDRTDEGHKPEGRLADVSRGAP